MSKRRKRADSTSAKIAEASALLESAGKILDDLEGEQPEPESALKRLSRKSYANVNRLYPEKKKPRKSKKKSEGNPGNA